MCFLRFLSYNKAVVVLVGYLSDDMHNTIMKSVYITQENGAVETRNKHNKEGESESNNDNGNTSDSDSYSISDNTNETDSSSNSGSSDGSSDSDKVMQTQKKAARVTRATQETRTILVMTSPLVTNIKERTKGNSKRIASSGDKMQKERQ